MNRRLAAGLCLLALLLGLALFSDSIAPHERGFMKAVRYDIVDGQEVMLVSPEPPSRFFLFGSDGWGYDLFSEMVHGLGWTLSVVFVTALLRSTAALAAGLAIGALRPTGLRRRRFSPLASIPVFILSAFVLYPVTINSRLPPVLLFAVQSGLLALVELPALAESFAARAADVLGRPFVEAARTAGAGVPWILRYHVLPFAVTDWMESLPVQALSVAALVGKLGVLRIFVGGTILTVDPVIFLPAKGEWLGLLGYYYTGVRGQPWLFLAPFAGWMLILTCVGLLSSGTKAAWARSKRILTSH